LSSFGRKKRKLGWLCRRNLKKVQLLKYEGSDKSHEEIPRVRRHITVSGKGKVYNDSMR